MWDSGTKCILWSCQKLPNNQKATPRHPFIICPIRHLRLDRCWRIGFSTDGFDGSRRISWQWIKCNLARLARRPLTDHQVVPLDPFLSPRPMLAIIFNSTWRIDLSCEKSSLSLDLSECCSNIFLTFDAWEGLGEVPAEIKFADKFSQVFSASRVLG